MALKPQSAEMTTDAGAIYQTTEGAKLGKQWAEEVGVLRNIVRSPDGKYIAVSAKATSTLLGSLVRMLGKVITVIVLASPKYGL